MLMYLKFVKPIKANSGLITDKSKPFIPDETKTYTAALLSNETIVFYLDNILVARIKESDFVKLIEDGTIYFLK